MAIATGAAAEAVRKQELLLSGESKVESRSTKNWITIIKGKGIAPE